MSYLVLARKYRPQTFSEVINQDHVTRTLINAISSKRVAHAILFSGPRGTGKTTVARILAKAMNCQEGPTPIPCNECRSCIEITSGSSVDVFEIDGASNNSVDQIRELRQNIKYMPAHSLYKIYIIDEVHMLSIAAFNALLKTLEEPPPHIMFVFATTEAHKIPITILSRCQRYDFRRIDNESISRHMENICKKEGAAIDAESLWLIAREAGGSMRDALSLLDQVITSAEGAIEQDAILNLLGVIDRKIIFDISEAILRGNMSGFLDTLDEACRRGHDIKKLYADLLEQFRNLLVVKIGKNTGKLVDLPAHEIEWILDQVKDVSSTFLSRIFDILFKEEAAIRFSSQPKLALEMAFIRILQTQPVLPVDMLIEKLDRLRDDIHNNPASCVGAEKETVSSGQIQDFSGALSDPSGTAEPKAAFVSISGNVDPDLDQTWKKIIDLVSEMHPSLAASLTKCSLKKPAARNLVIEVSGGEFNMKVIRRNKNIAILKKICSKFFGDAIDLDIINHFDPDRENQRKTQTALLQQDALSHPLVADTMEIFNGNVVDVKIL